MQWGKSNAFAAIEARLKKGLPIPSLRTLPELTDEEETYWRFFNELHNSRMVGFSACPIPISEICSLLAFNDITDRDDQRIYYRITKTLDRVWLETQEKERDRANDATRNRQPTRQTRRR